MSRHPPDPLFLDAEQLASDFSLFPRASNPSVPHHIDGLVSRRRARSRLRELRALDVDEYIQRAVRPAEEPARPGVRAALSHLRWPVVREIERGPLYAAEVTLEIGGRPRSVGVLAQDRSRQNGAWSPEHHRRAVEVAREFAMRLMPVVTFIDTPGAQADAEANRGHQAHAISRLIAEMAQLHVPTVGVVFGNGFSGGAIPLATTNILLTVVDGVFSTIQPRGLASIARKYNLSWQECARAVGVSAYELYDRGYVDGIVDYTPVWGDRDVENLARAVRSGIEAVESLGSHFAETNDALFDHYRSTVRRFVTPSSRVPPSSTDGSLSVIENPTQQPNIYGVAYRYLRYLGLRKRVQFTTVETYGRLSTVEIPAGDLAERTEREHREAFDRWLEHPLTVKYDAVLGAAWTSVQSQRQALSRDRGAVAAFFLGSREANFESARDRLVLELAFHVYNVWKGHAAANLPLLVDHLEGQDHAPAATTDPTVVDLMLDADVREPVLRELRLLMLFDAVYDQLLVELQSVAFEAMETNQISRESVGRLIDAAFSRARATASLGEGGRSPSDDGETLEARFFAWLRRLIAHRRRGVLLKTVADWKKVAHPTVSEPLFGLVTFFFDHLLPRYYEAERGARYDGRIRPRNIGIRDFWNRLDRAYKDLLIHEILNDTKRREPLTPSRVFSTFFRDVEEIDGAMMTADPMSFPGFRLAIEQALERGITPCGTVTALASVDTEDGTRPVGVLVSNLAFQAGSFDMASSVKLCRLLVRCMEQQRPVVCFVSSGGMQTKEGAGALFSMAIVNDRVTRFARDTGLPVLVFGFGDCTGGAQASLVTHPLVCTYYLSGTLMPFAGQIVVPSHLPTTSMLSNYLSEVDGGMEGLVAHPFVADLDERLAAVDPEIPRATLTIGDVMASVLEGKSPPQRRMERPPTEKRFGPLRKVLVHARGCTAVRLIDAAHAHDLPVVLVQSDPDMESVAAGRLSPADTLVCVGGSTPEESYLNAHSVIRIAEAEGCDALHPGIGFLSENPGFADLCARHGLNFIGPGVASMERTGNKSNAVRTAQRLGVPVVPGSHGVVTDAAAAQRVAEQVGFPVVLKAVHGGGGRGIAIVRRPQELAGAFVRMSAEAQSAFGSRDLYVEKLIERFRHVEIQVVRDRDGHTHVLGLRDCSVQRAQQKLIEESGSTVLPDAMRETAYGHARALVDDIGYVGVGTVEFIHDLDASALYFMEMNARLQVEHPVTEATTGLDIVGLQFRVAAGDALDDLRVVERGYAMELRINAERLAHDPERGVRILPDPGTVTVCELPERPDVRVIAAVAAESVISPFYDNLLVQVVGTGETRADVIATLCAWLDEARLEGIGSNMPLLRRILGDEEFVDGRHDTAYMTRLLERLDVDGLMAEVAALRGDRGGLNRSAVEIEGSDELKVVAPGPCVYYGSPGPGRPPFVSVGDRVGVDTTLCLVEAMKLFEELSLDTFNRGAEVYPRHLQYQVVLANAHDGQLVTGGDLLFVLRPLDDGLRPAG